MTIPVKIKLVDPRATIPKYANTGDSGMDLHVILDAPVHLLAGEKHIFHTGVAFGIPEGYEGQVRPRSGLTFNKGLIAALGTIDGSFVGECKICLFNYSFKTHIINDKDRIAQIVFAPVAHAELELVSELESTQRGTAGFGSSGV